MRVVLIGLSITSSWGNGHATNYRALVAELARRGHPVMFCERDVAWYAAHRDLPQPPGCELVLYDGPADLDEHAGDAVRDADLVIVGSYVPDGVAVAGWALNTARGAVAFYDIDTPVTLDKLARGDHEYLAPEVIPRFDLYLSFTAGPTLEALADRYGARRPLAFHCFVDPNVYRPTPSELHWDLGYLGTYSNDRQPGLEALLLEVARAAPERRFVVAGPQYPAGIDWPVNVERIEHLAPCDHSAFYAAQRFTLSITREQMRRLGWSPSVRLFEAAACGTPIITDPWPGVQDVFDPGREILVAGRSEEVSALLGDVDDARREEIARAARARVLAGHTAAHRVDVLEREIGSVGVAAGAA
ncbi:MAG TPA: glycosyltransferase [Solirubrobacteraceae bacterium]|jgi:spore maturation protein CgeB|nr:glycosyltransferase [Solirubrobacteraceae bacterium]